MLEESGPVSHCRWMRQFPTGIRVAHTESLLGHDDVNSKTFLKPLTLQRTQTQNVAFGDRNGINARRQNPGLGPLD